MFRLHPIAAIPTPPTGVLPAFAWITSVPPMSCSVCIHSMLLARSLTPPSPPSLQMLHAPKCALSCPVMSCSIAHNHKSYCSHKSFCSRKSKASKGFKCGMFCAHSLCEHKVLLYCRSPKAQISYSDRFIPTRSATARLNFSIYDRDTAAAEVPSNA